jgi:hypothetical protein
MEGRPMADRSLHLRSDADLEAALRGLAEAIDWPAAGPSDGADIAAVVRRRIEASPRPIPPSRWRWTWRPARRALVVAVIVVLALAALVGAASLGLPGLRLILGPPPVSPPPSLEPSRAPASGAPGAALGLGEEIPLADLARRAGFQVAWPTDPTIGPPDAAYIDESKGGQVALVWASRPGLPDTLEPGVGLVLTQFRGAINDGFYSKALGTGTTVQLVLVGGRRAFWLSGDPHFIFYEGPNGFVQDDRRWVGDTLIWADGPITHRLETSLGKDAAIRIAETMP